MAFSKVTEYNTETFEMDRFKDSLICPLFDDILRLSLLRNLTPVFNNCHHVRRYSRKSRAEAKS